MNSFQQSRGPLQGRHADESENENDAASAMARRVTHPDWPRENSSSQNRPIVVQRWQSGSGASSGQRIRISIGEENALYYYNRIKPLTLNNFFNFEELDCKAAGGKAKPPSKTRPDKTPGSSRSVPPPCPIAGPNRHANQRPHPGTHPHSLPSSSVSLPLIFGLLIDGYTWGGGGGGGGGRAVKIWRNKVQFKLDQDQDQDQDQEGNHQRSELTLKPVGFETQSARRRIAMAARQNPTMDQSQSVYFIINISLGGTENGPSNRLEKGQENGPVWRGNYHHHQQQQQQQGINRDARHPTHPPYCGSQQQRGRAKPWDMSSPLGRPNANGQVPIYQVERERHYHHHPQDQANQHFASRYHGRGPPNSGFEPRPYNYNTSTGDQWRPIHRQQHPHPPSEHVQHQPMQHPQFGQFGQETQQLETLMEEMDEAHVNPDERQQAKLMELLELIRQKEQMLLQLQQRAVFDPVVSGCCSNWNWLENSRQIEMITSLEYFPVGASRELLLGATLYALFDEHFYNLPEGWCYRGTLEPPVQMTMPYHPVYNTYHHQPPWQSWQWHWHWHQWPPQQQQQQQQQQHNGWQQQRQQQWYWQHFYWQQERQNQWQQQQQQLQEQQHHQGHQQYQEHQMQDQGQWRRQCIQRSRSRWNHHPPPYTNNQTSDAIMTFDAFPHGQKDLIMRCRQEEATASASANWKPPAQYKTLAETLASMEEPFSEPTEEILNLSRQNFPPLPKPQNR